VLPGGFRNPSLKVTNALAQSLTASQRGPVCSSKSDKVMSKTKQHFLSSSLVNPRTISCQLAEAFSQRPLS
jgi:hypothetical protein